MSDSWAAPLLRLNKTVQQTQIPYDKIFQQNEHNQSLHLISGAQSCARHLLTRRPRGGSCQSFASPRKTFAQAVQLNGLLNAALLQDASIEHAFQNIYVTIIVEYHGSHGITTAPQERTTIPNVNITSKYHSVTKISQRNDP